MRLPCSSEPPSAAKIDHLAYQFTKHLQVCLFPYLSNTYKSKIIRGYSTFLLDMDMAQGNTERWANLLKGKDAKPPAYGL